MKRPALVPTAVLAALIAVLLPAGVFAATTVGGRAGGDRQVSAAGFVQEGIVAGPTSTRPPESPVPTTTTTARPQSPTTTARNTSGPATAAPRPTTSTTVRPAPAASPTATIPPPLTPVLRAKIPAGSSWSATSGEVSVRMRMEPAAPVAGQPVTFYIDDLITQDPCCGVALMFGDSSTFHNVANGTCQSPTSRTGMSITHTYAAPGVYEAVLATVTFPCRPVTGEPFVPEIHGAGIHACIIVGPTTAGAEDCPSPPPVDYLPPPGPPFNR